MENAINKTSHRVAYEQFRKSITEWRSIGGRDRDDNLDKVYAKDRKALREVLGLFRKKKFNEAMEKAWRLDTIVRDVIPDRAWEMMSGEEL